MSRLDNTNLANKRNRVGRSKLQSELHRLDKERETEIRMLNNEKQRFKSKYSKLDVTSENRRTDPANVILYETHNPGFCYRRNGECRMAQNPVTNSTLAFEDVHALVFSEGEVDIDKVMCLHLLSAHRTETLTPPPKSNRAVTHLNREHSPLERLIDRSKKRNPENKLVKLLPVYVLDVDGKANKGSETLIRDGRLANRLIINDKVTSLISSVMNALDKSNKRKLGTLMAMSREEDNLKALLRRRDIQEFVKSLNGLNIISCCESFHLTLPFRVSPIILEVATQDGILENLIKQIRKNIFKLPISSTWDDQLSSYDQSTNALTLHQDSNEASSVQIPSPSYSKEIQQKSQNLDFGRGESREKQEDASDSVWKKEILFRIGSESSVEAPNDSTMQALAKETAQNVYKFEREIRKVPPKVPLSAEKPASALKHLAHELESPKKESNMENLFQMDIEQLACFLCKRAECARVKDLAQLKRSQDDKEQNQDVESCCEEVHYKKYSLKQTTCPACMHKWKNPLPSPKTSKIQRQETRVSHERTYEPVGANSTHIISKMIDQELLNWRSSKSKSSQRSATSSPRSQYSTQSNLLKNNVIEIIDLDDLDLAKIRQEIRENETRKKLYKFLGRRNI